MPASVFISYSRTDAAIAEQVRHRLGSAGVTVWIDHERLVPGTPDWDGAIRRGIQASDNLVYLASPNARESPYVKSELLVAQRFNRRIVPLWIAGEHWIDAAPLSLGTTQNIDARGTRLEGGVAQLLEMLDVRPQKVPASPPPSPTMPSRGTSSSSAHVPVPVPVPGPVSPGISPTTVAGSLPGAVQGRPGEPLAGRATSRRPFFIASAATACVALVLSVTLIVLHGGAGTVGYHPSATQGSLSSGAQRTSTVNCGAVGASSLHLVIAGQLTIGSDTTYAPAEYVDPNNPNNFLGYDMDLGRELARRLCLQPTIKTASFETIIDSLSRPTLGQQKFDLAISSFSINSSREQQVDFIPYFIAGESTLVAKGNPDNIHGAADLCGKSVSVQGNTTEIAELQGLNGQNVDPSTEGVPQQPLCKSKLMQILSYSSEADVIAQVVSGHAAAAYQDQPVTDYYISLHQSQLEHGFITANSQGTEGIAVRKDNPALENAIKQALNNMVSDGTYNRLMTHWGQQSLACLPNCPSPTA